MWLPPSRPLQCGRIDVVDVGADISPKALVFVALVGGGVQVGYRLNFTCDNAHERCVSSDSMSWTSAMSISCCEFCEIDEFGELLHMG